MAPKVVFSKVLDILDQAAAVSTTDKKKVSIRDEPKQQQRSSSSRASLCSLLQQKQRKLGNLWLARELGYQTEEEDLYDCRKATEQKRVVMTKQERQGAHAR